MRVLSRLMRAESRLTLAQILLFACIIGAACFYLGTLQTRHASIQHLEAALRTNVHRQSSNNNNNNNNKERSRQRDAQILRRPLPAGDWEKRVEDKGPEEEKEEGEEEAGVVAVEKGDADVVEAAHAQSEEEHPAQHNDLHKDELSPHEGHNALQQGEENIDPHARIKELAKKMGIKYKVGTGSLANVTVEIKGENPVHDMKPYGTPPDKNPKKNPKLLCFVLTLKERHDPKAVAVNRTWGQYCDKLLFITNEEDATLPTLVFPIMEESRADLWIKTRLMLLYAYTELIDDYDWVFKADDDTFAMIENMKTFLEDYDPEQLHCFGRKFVYKRGDPHHEVIYPSGGAGYVLSRALIKFLGAEPEKYLSNSGLAEDMELGKVLKKAGIPVDDTRDSEGRERFLPLRLATLRDQLQRRNYPDVWYWSYSYYYPWEGNECCSKRWITSHYAYSKTMYEYHKNWLKGIEARGRDPDE